MSAFLINCFSLSHLTSQLYDDFVEIRRFSSLRFKIETKLKILDFMKRFGKTPIGISVGGFFFIKKNFVIRAISALHSILSTLAKLGKEKANECNSHQRLNRNVSDSFNIFAIFDN
ncbi:uncharacterized protein LOC111629024 [Centruroides sculpturatus]|uniref:uncharacterized protein LOC111629024 n=1 Tax=Centruroides sculpturatus TaxID=218467 RepID=UPI000C6D63F8|nr:uncharacterized protein LOC111629024 [Centruroides sculpturatus]